MQGKHVYRGYEVQEGGASCFLSIANDIYVSSVFTTPVQRRQGHAKRMMKQIVRIGKRLKMRVTLNVAPYGESSLSFQDTKEFYRKCGFIPVPNSTRMITP